MKPVLCSALAALALTMPLLSHAGSAAAEFQKSNDRLFIDGLDLAVNPNPEMEFGAYAIVLTGGENLPVIYVITSNFKGKVSVLGSFRCEKEFTVLKSHTGGMRDIRCVRQDVFDRKTKTTLRHGPSGLYKEHF
jgi:hypothetical protein